MAPVKLPDTSSLRKSQYSEVGELEALAKKEGYTPPKKKGASTFSKLMGFLAAGETAPAAYAYLKGEDPLKAYGKEAAKGLTLKGLAPTKKTYADVLGQLGVKPSLGRTIGGTALDILLDPTTYAGGAIAKTAFKGAKIAAKPIVAAGKVAQRIPVLRPLVTRAETLARIPQVIENAFVPGAKIKRLGVAGERMWDDYLKFVKETRSQQTAIAEKLGQAAGAFRKTGKATDVLLNLEIPGKALDKDVVETARGLQDLLKNWAKEEKAVGVLKSELDNYLPHMLTKEAREALRKGTITLNITKPLRARLGAARPRKILGTINEINKDYMAKTGIKLFDDDIFKIVAYRGVDHVRAVKTKQFLDYVGTAYGVKENKLLQEAAQKGSVNLGGVKYVPYMPEGALRFYKGIQRPAEEIMYQIRNIKGGKSFEKAMTQTGKMIKAAEDLGIPVKRNMRLRKALGYFRGTKKTGTTVGEIGLKSFDPETAMHELGHLYDWVLSPQTWQRVSANISIDPKFNKELLRVGREYGGIGTKKKAEQFAEYFRNYILKSKTVKRQYPTLTKAFEDVILFQPEATQRLNKIREFIKKTDKLIPEAPTKLPIKDMPRWSEALWKQDPEIMRNLEKSLGVAFPTKEYVGVTSKVPKYLLPEPLAEHLNATYKFLTSDESINELAKMYDKLLSYWKGSVTGFFPAFHGRNFIGGVFNNWIGGLNNPTRYVQAGKIVREGTEGTIKLGETTYKYADLRKLMRQNGVLGQAGYLDVPKTIEEYIHPFAGFKKAINYPRRAMTSIENELRGAMFIDRLAKGDTAWNAAKTVIKYHFDYMPEGLTVAERTVMKRLIPFYTWSRNNIPLQLEQMIKQPGKYAAIGKMMRNLQGETSAQRGEAEYLPEYMKKGLPIRIGGKEGKPQYLYGTGLPLEDVGRLSPNELLSMLSPVIKAPLEAATGQHFYFERPLKEVDTAPKLLANAPKPIKDWLEYSEYKNKQGKTVRKLNAGKWNIVTNFLSRGIFTVDRLADPEVMPLLKILYGAFGVKGREVDIEQEKYWRGKERTEQLQNFLQKRGVLKEFSSFYKPK